MTLTRTSTHQSSHSRKSSHSGTTTAKIKANQSAANANANGPDPLAGHLNHLTPEQEEALKGFKKVITEQNLYTPPKDEIPASHDDATLLRFLRARKFDVNAALDQFKGTEEWRKENQIDALYENIDVDSYEESRRVYPQWTGRRDRRGIPVYVFVIKHLNSKNMAAYSSKASQMPISETHKSSSIPSRLLRLFALYENMTKFVLPLCSKLERPNPETPIVNTTNIVDISGVGLKQFWNLKNHMQDASVLATAHYPETLDRIFIIGAPAFFPTVWGWIKRWFDPVTTSKIFILSSSEVKPTLETFMDPSSFPKQYGGELDWEWGDMPSMDEPAREVAGVLERIGEKGDKEVKPAEEPVDGRRDFVKGPVVWDGDDLNILGSVDGKDRRRTLHMPKKEVNKVDAPAPAENGVQQSNGAEPSVNEKVPELQNGDVNKKEEVAVAS